MGSGRRPEIIISEHSSLRYPQIQVKVLSCKDEAICKHDSERCCVIVIGNYGCCIVGTIEERDLLSVFSSKVRIGAEKFIHVLEHTLLSR